MACEAHALALHAGAGAGKTLTLAHRVARLGPTPQRQARLLVVTFTRDATASLQRKLALLLGRDHLVRVWSFHQWAARELPPDERRFLDERDQRRILVDLLRREAGATRALGSPREALEEVAVRLAGFLGHVKNRETTVADAVAGPFAALRPHEQALARLRDAYEARKGDRLDYDDVPLLFRDRLRASPSFRQEAGVRLDHLFVDEYQDVNGAQAETVRILTMPGKGAAGVTVVGDPRQAIYGFRGASPRHLLDFPEPYGRRARVLALRANFRATRRLVEAANAVDPGTAPMRATRASRQGQPPRLVGFQDVASEAAFAVDHVEALLRAGEDAAEIAVLCRMRRLAFGWHAEAQRRLRDDVAAEGLDRVAVRTIHAAKGLEWDHVLLVGAREGGLPSDHALMATGDARDELLAEERRLAYVALTRARRTFVATWARQGRGAPSRFFAALAQEGVEGMEKKGAPVVAPRGVA